MLQIVILVCSAGLSPPECQRETALDVISGPRVASISACGMMGQATLAGTGLGRREGDFIKIRCEPVRPTQTAAR